MAFGFGYGAFEAMFTVVFVLILGIIAVTVIRGIGEWNKNNNSPRLVVDAEVVTKRTNVGNNPGMNGAPMHHTTYYVTFEVKGGDRLELCVDGTEYGQLVEGDRGELTFQGTRYIGFARTMSDVS